MDVYAIFNIGTVIRKMRVRNQQLNLYYPKDIYEPFARREMKAVLMRFNELFYEAYPETLKGKSPIYLDSPLRKHSKRYEVERDLMLYKAQKVRKRELNKIEEFLNLKYLGEEKIAYYSDILQKAMQTKRQLKEAEYPEYFPQLFEKRVAYLEKIELHCLEKLEHLMKDKKLFEQSIDELIHNPTSFWANTGRFISDVVTDSVKHVVDVVDQSFRKK